jgi:hypothetical protein
MLSEICDFNQVYIYAFVGILYCVVFEALYAHLQVQYLSYKVKGFFSSGLMIKDKKINFREPKLNMFMSREMKNELSLERRFLMFGQIVGYV